METAISKHELDKLMLKYNFALQRLETEIDILIKEYEFNNNYNPVEHIKSRIKTQDSALDKLERKQYDINAENIIDHIHDMVGMRIVCSFLSDVYDMVEIIKKSKQFIIREEKDYIRQPKETGYISYHLNILVPIYLNEKQEYVEAEIQIRTVAMDFWASVDHKLKYKAEETTDQDIQEEIYKCSLAIRELDEKMEEIKQRIEQ